MHIFTCISGSQSILQSEPARASALELAQVPGVWILLWRADAIALRHPALKSSGSHSPCWPCARTCERGREGFLQRGGRHCGSASTAAWLPFPEVPPSQAHSRTHLPLLVLVLASWLTGTRTLQSGAGALHVGFTICGCFREGAGYTSKRTASEGFGGGLP